MSECITRVTKINKIIPHENADALELAVVDGWQCVIPKNVYKEGDLCVYIPIDSVLPLTLETALFQNAKVKLSKGRIKTIKLRGQYSQGLVANIDSIKVYLGNHGHHEKLEEGLELTKLLEIRKHEPQLPSFQQFQNKQRIRYSNPDFHKYTSIENIKNYTRVFEPEDDVIMTEKIHGTNFRAGWVKRDKTTLSFIASILFYIKCIFNKDAVWQFVAGSHNVQLDPEAENLYCNIAKEYDLRNKCAKGEVLYGEIYGPNVQKGYHYGLEDGKKKLVIFDIRKDGEYVPFDDVVEFGKYEDIDVVPILYTGKFSDLDVEHFVGGNSIMAPTQKVREGAVLQSARHNGESRKILKCINPEYLLKGALTEFH